MKQGMGGPIDPYAGIGGTMSTPVWYTPPIYTTPGEIPEEIWEEDTRAAGALGPAALAPEGSVGEEPGDERCLPGFPTRTKLPHNFRCEAGHWHTVAHVEELLAADTPVCLLRRIVLEWCAL